MKHEGWTEAGEVLGRPVGSEEADRLDRLETLLRERAAPMGMISKADVGRLRERHVLDCLRAAGLLREDDRRLCDLGSGAGLPGLVLAIARPDLHVTLTEVRRHRAAFLEAASVELELPHVRVWPRRLETLRERFDVCTARAFADSRRSWEAAARLLDPSGRLIYWAGERFDPAVGTPEGVETTLFTSALARAGVLAMMSRQ